jgi:hypothetical protein
MSYDMLYRQEPPREASSLSHLPPLRSHSSAGPRRREAETNPSLESSRASVRSSTAMVKVAVDLAGVSALSLLSETRRHPLDLTPSVSTPVAGRSRRPCRPSPELIETSSTPPRAPSPLHACPLAAHHLLNRSVTDPTAAEHQPPLGKHDVAENPSSPRRHRLHATFREEEGSHAIRSESDGGVPLRCRQIRAGRWTRPAWLGPATPARFCFFSVNCLLFCKSLPSLKFDKN